MIHSIIVENARRVFVQENHEIRYNNLVDRYEEKKVRYNELIAAKERNHWKLHQDG